MCAGTHLYRQYINSVPTLLHAHLHTVDLAERLIAHSGKRVPIEFTGLRPGEKLHEILVATDEIGTARVHPRIIHAPASTGRVVDALAEVRTVSPDEGGAEHPAPGGDPADVTARHRVGDDSDRSWSWPFHTGAT